MKYQGIQRFSHKQHDKIGVLITNLGTPNAPTKRDLKKYLREFLSDPCSGQLILATDLYSSQYLFSDSFGVSPLL